MGKSKGGDSRVSRRDFLKKGAALGAGAAALGGLHRGEVQAQDIAWDHEADFVTIGAGTSGLSAAVSALDHGASVIMVEMNYDVGGHGLVSGGTEEVWHRGHRRHGVQ
jgi:NADPH-dependent 2,4-dienoyl-CoA reductase/sulfur reductase-like enzyme